MRYAITAWCVLWMAFSFVANLNTVWWDAQSEMLKLRVTLLDVASLISLAVLYR